MGCLNLQNLIQVFIIHSFQLTLLFLSFQVPFRNPQDSAAEHQFKYQEAISHVVVCKNQGSQKINYPRKNIKSQGTFLVFLQNEDDFSPARSNDFLCELIHMVNLRGSVQEPIEASSPLPSPPPLTVVEVPAAVASGIGEGRATETEGVME